MKRVPPASTVTTATASTRTGPIPLRRSPRGVTGTRGCSQAATVASSGAGSWGSIGASFSASDERGGKPTLVPVKGPRRRPPGRPGGSAASADEVRPDRDPRSEDPQTQPGPRDEHDDVAGQRPEPERQDREEADHEVADRVGGDEQDTEGERGPEKADHRPFEHEWPADEGV